MCHRVLDVLLRDEARRDQEAPHLGLGKGPRPAGGGHARGQKGVEVLLGQAAPRDQQHAERPRQARLALEGHLEQALEERLAGDESPLENGPSQVRVVFRGPHHAGSL